MAEESEIDKKLKALMNQYAPKAAAPTNIPSLPNPNPVVKKKASHHAPKPQAATAVDDDDMIIENPPPFNHYNSHDGYRVISGQKYYHGEKDPSGNIVNAPILNDAEWAAKCERFAYYGMRVDRRSGKTVWAREVEPAHLSKIELRMIDIMNKFDRVIILVHRGARKSASMLRRAKRRALDYGETMVYFSCAGTNVEELSENIRREFQDAPILRLYGNVIDKKSTNSKTKMFWNHQTDKRQPGLSVGTSEGKTRMGSHPDNIYLDDVVREDADESKIQQKNLKRWWTKQVLPMATANTHICVVGTIKGLDDLYRVIIEDPTFHVFKIAAIEEWPNGGQRDPSPTVNDHQWYGVYVRDSLGKNILQGIGNIKGGIVSNDEFDTENWGKEGRVQYYLNDLPAQGLDKNRMSMQEFLMRLMSMGSDAFEAEYQMNPAIVKEGYLKFSNIRWFAEHDPELPPERLRFQNTHAMLDQAYGETDRADYNALSVVDEYDGLYFILDLYVWRGGGVAKKKEMLQMVKKKYPFIQDIGVEAGLLQTEDVLEIQRSLPDHNITAIYQDRRKSKDEDGIEVAKIAVDFMNSDIPANKRAKVLRIINQWRTKLELHKVWMFSGINGFSLQMFRDAFSFPKCKYFDPIDSVGSCFELCGESSINNFFWIHG